jgi:hypothetical protein
MQVELWDNPRDKYSDLNVNDVVFTPQPIAEQIVRWANPKGKCLEPCMGEGVFFNLLPEPRDWCEITKGRDFYDYLERVDWIVTNPPYSDFDRFLEHSFELADDVVLLVPVAKVFKSWGTMKKIKKYGGIVKVWFVPASRCGFPFGFPAGAFHFQKGYDGETKIEWADE